jgi:hypothetical protein
MAAATANLVGFSHGLTTAGAESAGLWIFIAAFPVAVLGLWSAWLLGSEKMNPIS